MIYKCRFISVTNIPLWCGMLIKREAVHVGVREVLGNSMFSTQFYLLTYILKSISKNKQANMLWIKLKFLAMSLKPMLTGASFTFPPQVPPLIRCSLRSSHTGPSYCPQTCHAGLHLRTFALAVPSACKALHADLCRVSHHSGFRSNGTS